MNVINHIYIDILPRSAHATIRHHFSTFVTQQKNAHNRHFPDCERHGTLSACTGIMHTHNLDLLTALNYLRLSQDTKLYKLILISWNKVTIALLQLARNVQIIAETLIYNRTRTSKLLTKVQRFQSDIPEPSGPTLVQSLLHTHLDPPPIAPPIDKPKYTTTQRRLPCEHDRCTLYATANMSRGYIIGRAIFYPVCQIFNDAAKHTYHIERALKSRPRLRKTLAK